MDAQFDRVQTPCEVYIERSKVRRGQVPIFIQIVFKEVNCGRDAGVGDPVGGWLDLLVFSLIGGD